MNNEIYKSENVIRNRIEKREKILKRKKEIKKYSRPRHRIYFYNCK